MTKFKLNLVYTHLTKPYTIDWPNGVKLGDEEGFSVLWQKRLKPGTKLNMLNCFYEGEKTGTVQIYSANELPDERYVFPIEVIDDLRYWKHYLNKELDIPQQVEQDVINNKAKLLFFCPFEGHRLDAYDRIEFLQKQKERYKNILYADCNLYVEEGLKKEGIKGIYHNAFVNTNFNNTEILKYIDALRSNILNKTIRPNKFVCFNRVPKDYRGYMVNRFLEEGMVKDNIVTFQIENFAMSPEQLWKHFEKTYKPFELLKRNVPLVYDYQNVFSVNPTDIHIDAHLNSYFNIVNETQFYNIPNQLFFSEKIFKPMLCMQPFVVAGVTGSLKKLRELGFKTFGEYIDESYDSIVDDKERLEQVVQIVKGINNKTHQELSEMMYSMYNILEHNYNHHMCLAQQEFGAKNLAYRILNEW